MARRARAPDKYTLYELCAQSARDVVALVRTVHGGRPVRLGEDFCGTAAVSRAWVRAVRGGEAVGVDLDPEPLAWAPRHPRVRLVRGDVREGAGGRDADAIFVGNFSIGELHRRDELVAYLRLARARLAPGGVFLCDTYGGATAFATGTLERERRTASGERVRYTWQQRHADPLTGMVENAMHFRVTRDGELVARLHDAFVYRWRLWSVPELRDAMAEAGFASTEVYDSVPGAVDARGVACFRPVADPGELDASYAVCVGGRRT